MFLIKFLYQYTLVQKKSPILRTILNFPKIYDKFQQNSSKNIDCRKTLDFFTNIGENFVK